MVLAPILAPIPTSSCRRVVGNRYSPFLFYAFVVLLALLNYVYRLRSMFTLFQSCNDARSFLLMRHAGITNEAARALGRTMARDCGEDVRARLDRDTRSATGFIFNSFEEWMAQFVGSTRYL